MPTHACKGVLHSGRQCTLSRAKPGQPICIRGPCDRCRESRCRTHCRCGRNGTAKGRQAGRPTSRASATAASPSAVSSSATSAPASGLGLAPVGRPAALTYTLMTIHAWWEQLIEAVSGATEVYLATLVFDHSAFTAELLRRLKGRAPFAVTLMVDKESFEKRDAPHQRPRLRELRSAGARVYLCKASRSDLPLPYL